MYITGYSLRAPSSSNPREFYEALRDGKEMTTPTRRYPEGYLGLPSRTGTIPTIDRFDQDFFKFSTKQTEKLDVAIRLLLEVTHEALMDAQLPIEQLRGSKTGVYVGHCFSDFLGRSTCDKSLTGYELVNGAHAMAANKISFFYDFKGPSVAIDTACSSSLVALNQAVSDLRSGVVDRAVVSGLSLTLDPRKNAIFNAFTMLSPDGKCFTFDTRANGYCRSEGVVSVVLESGRMLGPSVLGPAGGSSSSKVLCRVLGTSVNSDGYKEKGITFPSGRDQAANALAALRAGGVDPASVTYVEAHGTGTVAGDKQELDGLSRAFYGDAGTGPEPGSQGNADAAAANGSAFRNIAIGSVKSAMGHAEGASGLISVVKCLAMFEHKKLLPNQNFAETTHPPLLDGRFRVVTELEDWVPGNVCISNYGFGGTNAFCVLAPPPPPCRSTAAGDIPFRLCGLPLCFSNSGTTKFEGQGRVDPRWLEQQVALGNDKSFKYRGSTGLKKVVNSKGGYDKLCFVFGGQGSQWPHMGKRLMSECPLFKQTIARLASFLKPLDSTFDLADLFESQGEQWMQKRFTVLGIAAYQIASVNLLAEAGLVPDFYMGHSLGETAAGYALGLQSEEETIKIAYVRSLLSSKIKPGGFVLKSASPRPDSGFPLLCTSQGFWFYDVPTASDAKSSAAVTDSMLGEEVFDNDGQMVAVGLPADQINSAISALGLRQTCVACFNGPSGQTVSGASAEVKQLKEHLLSVHGSGLFWREVDTDGVAYHAPHLNCYSDYLVGQFDLVLGKNRDGKAACRPLDGKWVPTSTKIDFAASSTATTTEGGVGSGSASDKDWNLSGGLVLDAHFHARNITSPVYFMQAIQALPPNTLVLEVGSAQSLLGQVKRVRSDVGLAGLATRGDPQSEAVYLSKDSLRVALWEAGYKHAFKATTSQAQLLSPSVGGWPDAAANCSRSAGGSEEDAEVEVLSAVTTVVGYDNEGGKRGKAYRAVAGKYDKGNFQGEVEEEKAVPSGTVVAAVVSVKGSASPPQSPPPVGPYFMPRVPWDSRWPDLWDHSRQQRVFGFKDFQLAYPKEQRLDKVASGGGDAGDVDDKADDGFFNNSSEESGRVVVAYDLVGEDAFLLHHRVNGRALFPATGHLYTMWQCACPPLPPPPSSSSVEADSSSSSSSGSLTRMSGGVRFTDFEILTAVVLDPKASPTVKFSVADVGGKLTVLHQGAVVARASFERLTSDFAPADKPTVPEVTLAYAVAAAAASQGPTTAAAAAAPSSSAVAPSTEAAAPASSATNTNTKTKEVVAHDKLLWLERGQLYNHFKRYGYEYQEAFQLVARRTVPLRKVGGVGCGVLRGACHVIPFLDNFLQLFLEDVSMLQLPTLVRECELLPGVLEEAFEGALVAVETSSNTLSSRCVTMRGIHTMPAAGPQHPSLTHEAHVFVQLGEQWRQDPETEAAFVATRQYTANAITKHLARHPQQLVSKPWLSQVLAHAKQWVVSSAGSTQNEVKVDAALYATSLHYRMHVDLYSEGSVEKLLERPFLTLSLHPEHDAFYETNKVVASSDAELAGLVGLVRKEWHGTSELSVFEGGAGSCGFTRRVVPLLGKQLGSYAVSDISAIRLGTLAGHPKIQSVKHDLNNPLPLQPPPLQATTTNSTSTTTTTTAATSSSAATQEGSRGQHHLILANNAIHTACDVGKTLAHFRDGLVEGGFVLLEEQVTDACLYLWGLDGFIWTTATDTRSFGLWMTWPEWEAVIEACQGMELLCCHRSQYHVTMLLRKNTAPPSSSATPSPAVTLWSQVEVGEGEKAGEGSQVVRGPGSEGLVKTLRLEMGLSKLKSCVDVDGSADLLEPFAPSKATTLPLTFNHVRSGKVGSLVVVPLHLKPFLETTNFSLPPPPPPPRDAAAAAASVAQDANDSGGGNGGNIQLHIVRPGDLSTLTWIEAPSSLDYSVAVAYSSLNFKDVMYAFGKLRLESPSFGLEFSGTEINVKGSSTPRRVMGIGTSACIAKRAKPTLCWEVPEGMALDEAATVPVVYATALFALFEKANLRKGQSVLVHAGSGGVGHAAIFLCQVRGIEVFTTCSQAKRAYVLEEFGLDEAHVGSSRDKSFRETVLRATNGEGVDCVLNSLSGSLLEPSLQCVKSFGHFCEIGKFDLQNNTSIGLKALERNVSYHAIDLATMFAHPRLSKVLKELLDDALDKKQVKPLPRTVFDASEVEQGLRFLSSGKHKGKVLVDMREKSKEGKALVSASALTSASASAAASDALSSSSSVTGSGSGLPMSVTARFTTSGTHVVTGGLGGFGLELALWLLEQGASKVVCTGRSGVTTGWQRYRVEGIKAKHGQGSLEVSRLDVRDEGQCRELLEEADRRGGGRGGHGGCSSEAAGAAGGLLKGIWHVAMVLHDSLFTNMTAEKWDAVNSVKVQGLQHLDHLSRTLLPPRQLDAFVTFSSVSSLFGNVGQANYAHANAACETIVQARVSDGLKGCAVQWGMIDNVGFFGANDAKVLETFLALQNVDSSLHSLHSLLNAGGVVTSFRFSPTGQSAAAAEDDEGEGSGGCAFELSVAVIQAKVAEILGGVSGDYDPDSPLNDYGLDSLSSIEVVNWMSRHTTQTVNPAFMTADMTINKVHTHMAANLKAAA